MWLTSASWCLWACQSAVFPWCWWLQHLIQEPWRVWCHCAEFAPTSTCDSAKQLMLMDFTLCGWPRSAWPCKPKISDLVGKGKTLCPLKPLGVFAPWYFGGWCDSCSPHSSSAGAGGWRHGPAVSKAAPLGPTPSAGVGQRYSSWFRQSYLGGKT